MNVLEREPTEIGGPTPPDSLPAMRRPERQRGDRCVGAQLKHVHYARTCEHAS